MVKMWNSSAYTLIFLLICFEAIPERTYSSPLIRSLRSPNTTPESHISNFLHQHRADSRADKTELHSSNNSKPLQSHPHKPKITTTEPPISQTELLVNLIHNTIKTVREQFPGIVSAISTPNDPPKATKHPKKTHHITHAHSMQERSTNDTSGEDPIESEEEVLGSGDDELIDEEEIPQNVNPVPFLPPALIRTIVEASGSSAARGSAGASAGSAASASAGVISSSSAGNGRNTRQADEHSHGSGSGEFLVSVIRGKVHALVSLFVAPIFGTSNFVQRSVNGILSSSSGIPAETDPRHHHSNEHKHHHPNHQDHSDDHHHSYKHNNGHDHRSESHHSNGHDMHVHGHHQSNENDHTLSENDNHHSHNRNSTEDDSANLILDNDDSQNNVRKLYYRQISAYNQSDSDAKPLQSTVNDTITNNPSRKDGSLVDGSHPIVISYGNLNDLNEYPNIRQQQHIIVRKRRESKLFFNEGFGIYILEIFGSIAGLTWGAVHQITHIFQARSDEQDDFY